MKKIIVLALFSVFFLQACQTEENASSSAGNETSIDVEMSGIYINYPQKPDGLLVLLNDEDVTSEFDIDESDAFSSFSKLESSLKNGRNLITVFHRNSPKDAQLFFSYDTESPIVSIETVLCNGNRCSGDRNENMRITGIIEDDILIDSLKLEVFKYEENTDSPIPLIDDDQPSTFGDILDEQFAVVEGENFSVNVSSGDIYRFIATDDMGNVSQTTFLADGNRINPILKMRLDNSMFSALRPTLNDVASQLNMNGMDEASEHFSPMLRDFSIHYLGDDSEQASTAPAECHFNKSGNFLIPSGVSDNCTWDGVEGTTTLLYIGRIITDKAEFNDFSISNTAVDKIAMDLTIDDEDDANTWGTEVSLRVLQHACKPSPAYKVKNPDDGKWYWFSDGLVCDETDKDGLFSLMYADTPAADGHQYATIRIDSTSMNGNLGVNVDDGSLSVDLSSLAFHLEGLDSDKNPMGIPIDSLTPIIEGAIGPLMQSIIDNALKKFELPLTFTGIDNGVQFSFVPEAYQVFTDISDAEDPSWYMYYRGLMKTDIDSIHAAGFSADDIKPVLGSRYIKQSLPQPKKQDEDNFSLMLNSNFINQGLLTLYNSGFMHIGVFNEKLYFGPKATNDLGDDGDTQVRLIPNSPATLSFDVNEEGENVAKIDWRHAQLFLDKKKEGGWSALFGLDVNFSSTVLLTAENNIMHIELEAPKMEVNDVLLGSSLNNDFVKFLLEITAGIILPQLADQTINIAFPLIKNSDGSTVGFDLVDYQTLNGGHMNVLMDVSHKSQPIP